MGLPSLLPSPETLLVVRAEPSGPGAGSEDVDVLVFAAEGELELASDVTGGFGELATAEGLTGEGAGSALALVVAPVLPILAAAAGGSVGEGVPLSSAEEAMLFVTSVSPAGPFEAAEEEEPVA